MSAITNLFLQQYATDSINPSRYFLLLKANDIFMAIRTKTIAAILVKTKVKRCTVLYN